MYRNMRNTLPSVRDDWRLVITDRFFTSIALAIALAAMNVYIVGTIMTNKLGYCKDVIDKRGKRTTREGHGDSKVAVATNLPAGFPSMHALSWMDIKPVHFLSTGATVEECTICNFFLLYLSTSVSLTI